MKSKKMDSSFDIGFNYYSNRNYRSYLNYQSYQGAKIIFFFETYKKRQIFPLAKEASSKSIESTSKCKFAAKLGIMFEKDLIRCIEI